MCNEFCDSINVTLILDQVASENEPKFNAKAFHRIHIMLEHFGSGRNSVFITKKFLMCNEFCDSINVTLILDQVTYENKPKFDA
jgi:hypothetical protein